MNSDDFKYFVSRIVEKAKEQYDENKKNHNEFNIGKSVAYFEILDMLQNQLEVYGQNLEDYGLDFDVTTLMN